MATIYVNYEAYRPDGGTVHGSMKLRSNACAISARDLIVQQLCDLFGEGNFRITSSHYQANITG